MKKSQRKALSLSTAAVLYLAATAVGQSPAQPAAEPVGVIATNSNQLTVNGAAAQRGSTVFNGNEIQTGHESASVNLTSGGGVLSIAPGSRVKVSREPNKIIVEVLTGSVRLRSPLASTVITPDRIVNSEAGNLYTVSISDAGTVVESGLKSVTVKAMGGAVQTIASRATGAVAALASPLKDSFELGSASAQQEPITPYQGCFVVATCQVTGITLKVRGVVLCSGNPVSHAAVTLSLAFGNGVALSPLRARTVSAGPTSGQYEFVVPGAENVPAGGTAVVTVGDCGPCADGVNRCTF